MCTEKCFVHNALLVAATMYEDVDAHEHREKYLLQFDTRRSSGWCFSPWGTFEFVDDGR